MILYLINIYSYIFIVREEKFDFFFRVREIVIVVKGIALIICFIYSF